MRKDSNNQANMVEYLESSSNGLTADDNIYSDANAALERLRASLMSSQSNTTTNEIVENLSDVRQMLESTLFQRLYQMQLSLQNTPHSPHSSSSYQSSTTSTSTSSSISKQKTTKLIDKTSKSTSSSSSDDFLSAIRTVQLKRASHELNYGFTIILINHSGLNQTFVFVQDVEPRSIAR